MGSYVPKKVFSSTTSSTAGSSHVGGRSSAVSTNTEKMSRYPKQQRITNYNSVLPRVNTNVRPSYSHRADPNSNGNTENSQTNNLGEKKHMILNEKLPPDY